MKNIFGERIYTLDALRGIASLSVVFWHWRHFFHLDNGTFTLSMEKQPFYQAFSILYGYGLHAVELFFVISGFVFFHLYYSKIQSRAVTAKEFFVKRITRLYPLFILSSILVGLLQFFFKQHHNSFFVYQQNDLYHAFLNILMIQAWGFQHGWSFNAPSWSISIEVLLYTIFFTISLISKRPITVSIFIIVSSYYFSDANPMIASGMFCFYTGVVAYIACTALISQRGALFSLALFAILCIASWSVIFSFYVKNIYLIVSMGFLPLVCALASLSAYAHDSGKSLEWLGNISFSSYLLHFPLQIAFATCCDLMNKSRDIFYSPYIFIAFWLVLIPISLASFHFFEKPSQEYLRKAFGKAGN
ncbi:acyltransferase [uncultured Pantoea sp.]|nr:acyltransferase [uncultured Pantoea sp.]